MVLSLLSHQFILFCLRVPPSHYLLFFFLYLLFSIFHSAFRLAVRKGLSARLPLVSLLWHHANHGRGKMMVVVRGGIWFWPNLATCSGSFWWVIVPQGANFASSFFYPLHLHQVHTEFVNVCWCYVCEHVGLAPCGRIDSKICVSVISFYLFACIFFFFCVSVCPLFRDAICTVVDMIMFSDFFSFFFAHTDNWTHSLRDFGDIRACTEGQWHTVASVT